MMACSVPFNNKNLDINFFVFKPTIAIIDDLVHGLKLFSISTESLGCVQSSIFRSIHGNMVIWCATWQKQSSDKKEQLTESLNYSILDPNMFFKTMCKKNNGRGVIKLLHNFPSTGMETIVLSSFFFLFHALLIDHKRMVYFSAILSVFLFLFSILLFQLSMLTEISSMAVLVEHSFLEAYAGESRDGSSAAKFSTGDIISMNSAITTNSDLNDFCYAVLAIFRSSFAKMEGISAGLCLKGQSKPRVFCLHVWKSLLFCYSWIIKSDHRKWMLPYLERFSIDMKYDIFRVVYVSGDSVDKW